MIDNESIEDYVKFPDPWLYLIGFVSVNNSPIKEEHFHSKVSVKNTQAKRNSNMSSQQSRNSGRMSTQVAETINEASNSQLYQTLTNRITKEFREELRTHKRNQHSIQVNSSTIAGFKNSSRNRQQHSQEDSLESPHTLKVLMKRLNKPEMLLLNHLQN